MVESSHSTSGLNRAWRGQPRAAQPSAAGRHARRVLLSLLGLVLTGALAWLLWWWIFLPGVHLACLPVVDYDVLAVPPIPFSAEDVDLLSTASRRAPATVLRDLETSESIATLGSRLQGIVTRPKDTLILYLSAQGISDDGTAYLLCSDYLRGAAAGRYKLADLLGQLARCPAALKLLLLDTGHIAADPRLGMVVNEFPRLLETEVKRVGDPNLWVLAANRPLEVSHVSYAAKQSIFGHFVAAGLQGAADRNGDGIVNLAELLDFVRGGVADSVSTISAGQDAQTPWLLQGGVGTAAAPAGLGVLTVSSRAPQNPAETPPASNTEGKQQGPTPGANGRTQVRDLLSAGWQLRDQVQQRNGPDAWCPIDYAPALWREYEELLLGYQWRYCSGEAFDAKELADGLRANILPLKDLIQTGVLPPEAAKATVLARLADARQRFLNGEAYASFAQRDEDVRALRDAVQLRNDLLHRAPYWVRWHAQASRAALRQHRLYRPLGDLLRELARFVDLLDAAQLAMDEGKSRDDRRQALAALADAKDMLVRLRSEVEQDGLEKDAAELLKNPKAIGAAASIEALLCTPLLPGRLRVGLLDAQGKVDDLPVASPGVSSGAAGVTGAVSQADRDRLLEQARLEVQLVALANPQAPLAQREWQPVDGTLQSEPQFWQQYRQLGTALATFYQALPERINSDARSTDPAIISAGGRLLRFVDARDARRIRDEADMLAVRAVRLPAVVVQPKVEVPAAVPVPPVVPPDVVDVVVSAPAGTPAGRAESGDRVVLRPFPNRVTSYRFSLLNRSGRAKKVSVELLAVPETSRRDGRGRASPLDDLGNVRPVFKRLTGPLVVDLPADAAEVPIPFPEPKPPAAEKAAKPEKPAESPAGPPPLVTRGLLCLVRDVPPGDHRWIRWIDLAPLAPRDYLEPEVDYDLRQRMILIAVKAAETAESGLPPIFPPDETENPIKVIWETAGVLDPATKMNDRGEIAAPGDVARLFASIEPGLNKEVPVRLTVDGYPRAFQYQVKCDRDRQQIDRQRSLTRVRITSPRAGEAFRIPLAAPIALKFQVDAPDDAFQDPGDVVEVGINVEGGRLLGQANMRQLFSDRQCEIRLQEIGPRGLVRLLTSVSDFDIRLDPGGLRNTKVSIAARLLLAKGQASPDHTAADDSVEVVLDGTPPVLEVFAPQAITRGEDVKVSVRVLECLSGVAKMELGFDLDKSGELKEADKPKVLREPGSDGTWTAALSTKDLEPGSYDLLVRATSTVGYVGKGLSRVTVQPRREAAVAARPATCTIVGQVVLQDRRPLPRIRVSLEGTSQIAVTDESGNFIFRDLPAGKYTLRAKGPALGRELSGAKEIVLPSATDPARVEIVLEW